MQDWDTTLKLLITESAASVLPLLGADSQIKQWLNVELPRTQNLRVDLLAELVSGQLRHIELQSTNLRKMPFRMLEYSVSVYRCRYKFPIQTLVYVGNKPLCMKNYIRVPGLDFQFEVIDLKTLDGTSLLRSGKLSDNLLALLMAVKDKAEAIRRIIGRINRLDVLKRKDALARLLVTCGMRKLLAVATKEIEKMSITSLVLEDPYLAKLIRGRKEEARKEGLQEGRRTGLEEGREKGRVEGLNVGRDEGKRQLMRSMIRKRFGRLPASVNKRLSACSNGELDALALKILDCKKLDQLFSE